MNGGETEAFEERFATNKNHSLTPRIALSSFSSAKDKLILSIRLSGDTMFMICFSHVYPNDTLYVNSVTHF